MEIQNVSVSFLKKKKKEMRAGSHLNTAPATEPINIKCQDFPEEKRTHGEKKWVSLSHTVIISDHRNSEF